MNYCFVASVILLLLPDFSHSLCAPNPPQIRRKMSWPLEQFDAAPMLDGSLAGDAGFDPLGIAKSKEILFSLREGEIKHARIAMLAAVGWPVSELFHYTLASYFDTDLLSLGSDGRAPSVLNGGLDNALVLLSLGAFFAIGGVLEFELMRRRREVPESLRNFFNMWREDGWDLPGNYGFGKRDSWMLLFLVCWYILFVFILFLLLLFVDPLKLGKLICGEDDNRKLFVQTIEIFNGRVSMLACVGYVVQEFVTGKCQDTCLSVFKSLSPFPYNHGSF